MNCLMNCLQFTDLGVHFFWCKVVMTYLIHIYDVWILGFRVWDGGQDLTVWHSESMVNPW